MLILQQHEGARKLCVRATACNQLVCLPPSSKAACFKHVAWMLAQANSSTAWQACAIL